MINSVSKNQFNKIILRIFLYLILTVFVIYYLLPLFVMITTSLKSLEEIRTGSLIALPRNITFEAWGTAWSTACTGIRCEGLKPFFWNSIFIAIPAVIISTLIGAINGYVIAQWRFKGANIIFALMLFGCFIPFQVILLPMARVLGLIDLAGSILGLIFVHVIYGIGFTTLFFRNYYVSIPVELVKAAKIDGATFLRIFWSIFWSPFGAILGPKMGPKMAPKLVKKLVIFGSIFVSLFLGFWNSLGASWEPSWAS